MQPERQARWNDDSLFDFLGSANCGASTAGCQVEIPAGATIVDVQVTTGGTSVGPDDTITVSLGIPMESENLVVLGTSSTHTLTIEPPTVSLVFSGSTDLPFTIPTPEGRLRVVTVTLSERLGEDVVVDLISGGSAGYGTDALNLSHEWFIFFEMITNRCTVATRGNCQLTIPAGMIAANFTINPFIRQIGDTVEVSIDIASAGATRLKLGTPSSLTFTVIL